MLNEEGKPKTSHTTNKVPFVMANAPKSWSLQKKDGVLGDVAPTVLDVMGIPKPEEMGGSSLLVKGWLISTCLWASLTTVTIDLMID
jgi:2,3-bisphosphoglycerate-independent phosphoglycerate mutase